MKCKVTMFPDTEIEVSQADYAYFESVGLLVDDKPNKNTKSDRSDQTDNQKER